MRLNGNPDYDADSFRLIGAGTVLGLPITIWMLIVVAGLAAYIARRTPLGRCIYAVGGNERGAALSGVKVDRSNPLFRHANGADPLAE